MSYSGRSEPMVPARAELRTIQIAKTRTLGLKSTHILRPSLNIRVTQEGSAARAHRDPKRVKQLKHEFQIRKTCVAHNNMHVSSYYT